MNDPQRFANHTTRSLPDWRVLLVPIGATEQHGPHLPLSTDTVIAEHLAHRAAARSGDDRVLVAPAIPFGASGEHQSFAGTISVGTEALASFLIELVRSAIPAPFDADAHRSVLFVNGHGGNTDAVGRAVTQLRNEGRTVDAWSPTGTPDTDTHAGHAETSVVLALQPDLVDRAAAEAGATGSLRELLPQIRSGGVASVSPNGVLGDPTEATPVDGHGLLETWSVSLAQAIAAHLP